MLPCSTAIAAVNAPPKFEQDERHVPFATPAPLGLLVHGKRRGAHFVRSAHVNTVHLAVRWHRREVYDTRREDDWRGRGARKRPA